MTLGHVYHHFTLDSYVFGHWLEKIIHHRIVTRTASPESGIRRLSTRHGRRRRADASCSGIRFVIQTVGTKAVDTIKSTYGRTSPAPATLSPPPSFLKKKMKWIYWDLETTGLGVHSRIISIGWSADGCEGELLVIPDVPIDPTATAIHGHTMSTLEAAGAQPVSTQLHAFVNVIRAQIVPVCLCAHNGKAFDSHVLRAELERADMALPSNVVGFGDSMQWARYTLGIRPAGLDALNLRLFDCDGRTTHSALADAQILRRIVVRLSEEHSNAPIPMEPVTLWLQRTHKTCASIISMHLHSILKTI